MLALIKQREMNQYILKVHFQMTSLYIHIVFKVFSNMPYVIQHYWSLYAYVTNNPQELTPHRLEFKCDTNRIRNYFLSMPSCEPESLG
jgi:hypothetical protein